MEYGTVPHFDKPVSRIVLGIMPLGADRREHSFAILDAYRELGGNTLDNSIIYGKGELMTVYYRERGEDALIRLDKGCHHNAQSDEGRRVTREAVDQDIRGNIEKQGVSYSDFFVLHRDDPRVHVGDVVEWLNEHKAAGRIKAFGGSNWHHSRIAAANEYAERNGLQGFSLSSPNLSLATVNEPMWWEAYTIDRQGRDWHEQSGFPLFSWSSAGGGWFAGVESPNVVRVYQNDENRARRERARELAKKHGVTPYQIALAWVLCQPMNVFALVGPESVEQVRMNMETVDLKLSPDELKYLEHGE